MSAESTLDGTATPRFFAVDVSRDDHSWFGQLASAYLAKRLEDELVKDVGDVGVLLAEQGARARQAGRG